MQQFLERKINKLDDHPQIKRALRTGYPEPVDAPLFLCQDTGGCGAPIYPGDTYFDVDGFILCEDCGRAYLDERFGRTAREHDR